MRVGYACLNQTLRDEGFRRKRMNRMDFDQKGLSGVGEAAIHNLNLLMVMMDWNHSHGLHLLRTTDLFPWMDQYEFSSLPQWDQIQDLLKMVGQIATALDQRITVHPSSFCVMGSPTKSAMEISAKELNQASRIFDLMGFDPSRENKINIHIGGVYGDKESTMERFCQNVEDRLIVSALSRLTVENDDRPGGYTVEDLYNGVYLETGVPIVFDYLHHTLNSGGLSHRQALDLAVSTWPDGVTPIVHMSSSKRLHEDPKARQEAHADHLHDQFDSFGHTVDVMVEAKQTEKAAIRFLKMTHGEVSDVD